MENFGCRCVENFEKHYSVLLLCTKIMVPCGWIEGCSSCYNIPRYLVWDRRIHRFQLFPDVFSKTGVVCISVLEAVEILTIPFLEVVCAASLSFNLIVVKSCDGSSVDNICHCTSSWHWHSAFLLPWQITTHSFKEMHLLIHVDTTNIHLLLWISKFLECTINTT